MLAEVKSNTELMPIPVVILTTSEVQEDILRSYSLHANAYISKPIDFERFMNAQSNCQYLWIKIFRRLPAGPPRRPGPRVVRRACR